MPQGYEIVDLPGFGYMQGTGHKQTKHIWDVIVRFIEDNVSSIQMVFIVVSIENFRHNVEKWESVQDPLDLEMAQFLRDLKIPFRVIANKIDKVTPLALDEDLQFLAEKMLVLRGEIFAISAKKGYGLKPVKDFVGSLFR